MIRATRPNLVRLACVIALPLALAACGRKEPDASAKAAGEILEGSVSDAMLPFDTVRSQPPLAPRTEAAKPGGKADDDEGEAAEEATDATATATDGTVTPPTIAVPPATTPTVSATAP
jgi:hypothetical protein